MGRNPLAQARVEPSTKEAIEDYADRHDLSQSEATRRLIHTGLANEGYQQDGSRNPLERIADTRTLNIAILFGILGIGFMALAGLLANASLAAALGALVGGTILFAIMAALVAVAALAQVALADPLRELLPFAKDGETA